MHVPFKDTAEAVCELARWEEYRLELITWARVRDPCRPAPPLTIPACRTRLARVEAAARILTILTPLESVVRALHPLLMPYPTIDLQEVFPVDFSR